MHNASRIHEVINNATSKIARFPSTIALAPLSSFVKSWWSSQGLAAQATEPPSLNTLPLELQVEILKELDWVDVLRVRQVSRRLLLASKEKAVWTAISKSHEDERGPRSHVLEKRLSVHTAAELEEAFLRPRRIHLGWNRPSELVYRAFNVRPTEAIAGLLPGGRWAISTDTSGDVLCYDLDSPSEPPPHFSLVPHPSSLGRPSIATDHICDEGPYFAFNLATFHTLPVVSPEPVIPPQQRRKTGYLQVFRIGPEFDENGCVVGLSSTLLSTFDPGPRIFNFRLNGPYVTYFVDGSKCIVNWTEANNMGRAFSRRWLYLCGDPSDILPNDLFITLGRRKISLYNIKAMPLSTAQEPPNLPIEPLSKLWDQPIKGNYEAMTFRRTKTDASYFLYGPNNVVRFFVIPNRSHPTPPSIMECHIDDLTKTYQPRGYSPCLKIAEFLTGPDGRKTLRRGRLIWPPRADGTLHQAAFADIPLSSEPAINNLKSSCLAFEGLSGRIIVSDPQISSWVVLSIVL